MATLPRDKYRLGEVVDRWSRGQALRQQTYGAGSEKMLDLANVQVGSRVLDVAAGTGDHTLKAARRVGPNGYLQRESILHPGWEKVVNGVTN